METNDIIDVWPVTASISYALLTIVSKSGKENNMKASGYFCHGFFLNFQMITIDL